MRPAERPPETEESQPQIAPRPEVGPTPTPAPAPARPSRFRGSRNLRLWIVLGIVVLGTSGYGIYWVLFVRGTVKTDDAYVDAPIVSIAPSISGRVAEVTVKEGDRVKAGQLLLRLASGTLENKVDQARAELAGAKARLATLLSGTRAEEIAVAKAQVRVLEVELARRQTDLQRAMRLARINAIPREELDNAQANVQETQAKLAVSREQVRLLQAGTRAEEIEQARADVRLAEAKLEGTLADLEDARVISPIDGVVARRRVDPGEWIEDAQGVFQIVDINTTWVVANVEEGDIASVKEGQPVHIWVDAYPNREFRGRVGPQFAATLSRFSLLAASSASGTFIKVVQRVPVRIDWAQDNLPELVPGLNVTVVIDVGRD